MSINALIAQGPQTPVQYGQSYDAGRQNALQMRGQEQTLAHNQQVMGQNALKFQQEQQTATAEQMQRDVMGTWASVATAPPEQRQQAYQTAITELKARHGQQLAQLPDQYPGDDGFLAAGLHMFPKEVVMKIAQEKFAPKPQEPYSLGPNELRFDANNRQVASGGAPPMQLATRPKHLADGTVQDFQYDTKSGRELGPYGAPYKPSADAAVELRKDMQTQKRDDAFNKLESSSEYSIDLLDKLVKHPGLSAVVGVPGVTGGMLGGYVVPGTDAAGFKALHEQIGGRQFLEAYNTLKGGGAITEVEGTKATNAIARLQKAQKETEFIDAANEFKGVIERGLAKARAMHTVSGDTRIPGGTPASGGIDALVAKHRSK